MQNGKYIKNAKLISIVAVLLCVTVLAGFSFKRNPVYERDENGKIIKVTEYYNWRKVEHITTHEYDGQGNLSCSKTVYYKENGEVDYTYLTEYSAGKKKLTTSSHSDGSTDFSHYDYNGNVVLKYFTEFGVEVYREEMAYDSNDRLIKYTDYMNGVFRNSYTKEYYPSGKVSCEVFYDENGNERDRRYFDESGMIMDNKPEDAAESSPEPTPQPAPKPADLSASIYTGKTSGLNKVDVPWTECTTYSRVDFTEDKEYHPDNVVDGKLDTCWMEGGEGFGVYEVLVLGFDGEQDIDVIEIYPGNQKSSGLFKANYRPKELTLFLSDRKCTIELADTMGGQIFVLSETVKADHLEIRIKSVYENENDNEDTAISEVVVYSNSSKETGDLISVDYADTTLLSGGSYHHYSDGQEYREAIVIEAASELNDVHFFQYEMNADGLVPGMDLYALSTLTEDKPLVVEVEFPGDLTTYGIRFVDDNGCSHSYRIYISGKDGSLVLDKE